MLLDTEGNEIKEEETHVDDHLPTDEELSAAFDDFVGDKREELVEEVAVVPDAEKPATETPEQIEERVRHAEDSRLGRKVARIESMFEELSRKIVTKDDLPKFVEKPVIDEEIDDITDVTQLDRFVEKKLEERERRVQATVERERTQYQENYLGTMKDLIADIPDEKIAKEVYKKMLYDDKFNVKLSNNAILDSAKNFNRAYNSIISGGKPVTRFDEPRGTPVPAGVSGATTTVTQTKKVLPKLDADAYEFMKQTGMSEDDVIDALEGEMPIHLRGKVSA